MTTSHRIVAEHESREAAQALENALYDYNRVTTQLAEYHSVLFCVRDEAQAFLGGIAGYVWGGWLHITMLWLHESARKQGLGVALLQAAEQYGREHDCGGVYLSTFDFQAPQFYQKYGYQLFGQLADCPRGYTSFYLQKRFGE